MATRADFSRTCEPCPHVRKEEKGSGPLFHRCMAPGRCQGYTVSERGHFLPYVPAWCPLLDAPAAEVGGMEERDGNGGVMRHCLECEWCKPLEASDGKTYYFCMDAGGGAFLEETGLCGWCTAESGVEP